MGKDPAIADSVYAGNAEADRAAGEAAASHQVPHAVAKGQEKLEEMNELVIKRLVALAAEALQEILCPP